MFTVEPLLSVCFEVHKNRYGLFFTVNRTIRGFNNKDTVMLTFLCRDRDLPVTIPPPVLSIEVPLAYPCVPRVHRSFSVLKRSLTYEA